MKEIGIWDKCKVRENYISKMGNQHIKANGNETNFMDKEYYLMIDNKLWVKSLIIEILIR